MKQKQTQNDSTYNCMHGLIPRRQELIRPALEHPQDYVLLSLRAAARMLKADPMTTLRTIRDMGFANYPAFQKFLHELSVSQATMLDIAKMSAADVPSSIRDSLNMDMRNLRALRNTLDEKKIKSLVNKLFSANRVYLVGSDQAACLVKFMQYTLSILGRHSFTLVTAGEVVNTLRAVGRRDLVICISFGRGLLQTVEGLKIAKANGAHCVGITDTHVSPIARLSNQYFVASLEGPSFAGSYVSSMALINVILVACVSSQRSKITALLKDSDKEHKTGFRWYRGDSAC